MVVRMIGAALAALDGSALRIKCKRNSKAVSVIVGEVRRSSSG